MAETSFPTLYLQSQSVVFSEELMTSFEGRDRWCQEINL